MMTIRTKHNMNKYYAKIFQNLPDGASPDLLGEAKSSCNIISDDSSPETVVRIICPVDDFLERVEFENALDWAENLEK